MNQDLKDQLKECDTLNQMWMCLDDYYDLDEPLGRITKGVVLQAFIKNLNTLLKVTRTPERGAPVHEEEEET